MAENNDFKPNWTSAPGETIADILEERHISIAEFAQQMGYTVDDADQLLCGSGPITVQSAIKLETLFGASVEFWMARESHYREGLLRLQTTQSNAEAFSWLSELPVKDMVKFGWIAEFSNSKSESDGCLDFFGVPDVITWRRKYSDVFNAAVFRTSPSFKSNPGAVAAWLRQGEIEGATIHCQPWDPVRFQAAVTKVRALTRKKDPKVFIPELRRYCAECGVAIAIVRAPDGCRASGATCFLSPDKALLLLSFRYLSDDHFWFTFFHEAGHLLLHSKSALFLEGGDLTSTKEEEEANDFAAKILIPPEFQRSLFELPTDARKVIAFAQRIGVAPGIVVGQLQHYRRVQRNHLNGLKRRFTWDDEG